MKIIDYFCYGQKIVLKFIISLIWHFFIGLWNLIIIIPKYFILGLICLFSRKKRAEVKQQKKSIIPFIMVFLCLIIYFIAIFIGSRWAVQNLKNKYLTNDIISSTTIIEKEEEQLEENDEPENDEPIDTIDEPNTQTTTKYYPNDYWDYINVSFLEVDFTELLTKNSDTVGWIKIENTNVNYPIVQATDNDYYLHHSFNKGSNSAGWIFADFRDNFTDFKRNTIIYGHNMNNKTMFGSLPWLLKSDWLNNSNNHYIRISTPTSNSVWKVFSVYIIASETYYLKTSFNDETFLEFVNVLKGRSTYNFGVEFTSSDRILTLSTCDDTGTKRMVTHAKMVNIEYK